MFRGFIPAPILQRAHNLHRISYTASMNSFHNRWQSDVLLPFHKPREAEGYQQDTGQWVLAVDTLRHSRTTCCRSLLNLGQAKAHAQRL